METSPILVRIEPDDKSFRHLAMLVDHRLPQPAIAAHVDVRQEYGILDRAEVVDTDVREQQGTAHGRAADDAAAGDDRVERRAAPVVVVEHEFRRRQLLLVRPDRPVRGVEVQLGHDVRQRDIRFPEGVDRPDVAPVRNTVVGVDAAFGKIDERIRASPWRRMARDEVLAEVVTGLRVVGIAHELVVQKCGVEHVDAHAGQRAVRLDPAPVCGRGGFSWNAVTRRAASTAITPKCTTPRRRGTSMQRDRHARPGSGRGRRACGRSPSCTHGRRRGSARIGDRAGAGYRDSGRRRRPCPDTTARRSAAAAEELDELVETAVEKAPAALTCRLRLCDLYCVQMPMRRIPEFTQFDNAKSMIRNLPPNGSDGFARQLVSSARRLPLPPARMSASVLFVGEPVGAFAGPRRTSASSTSSSVTLLFTAQPSVSGATTATCGSRPRSGLRPRANRRGRVPARSLFFRRGSKPPRQSSPAWFWRRPDDPPRPARPFPK